MNYNDFVSYLEKSGIFEENLPIKTIYKRLRYIIDYAERELETTEMMFINASLINILDEKINKPFFGHNAIGAKLEMQIGNFGAKLIITFCKKNHD